MRNFITPFFQPKLLLLSTFTAINLCSSSFAMSPDVFDAAFSSLTSSSNKHPRDIEITDASSLTQEQEEPSAKRHKPETPKTLSKITDTKVLRTLPFDLIMEILKFTGLEKSLDRSTDFRKVLGRFETDPTRTRYFIYSHIELSDALPLLHKTYFNQVYSVTLQPITGLDAFLKKNLSHIHKVKFNGHEGPDLITALKSCKQIKSLELTSISNGISDDTFLKNLSTSLSDNSLKLKSLTLDDLELGNIDEPSQISKQLYDSITKHSHLTSLSFINMFGEPLCEFFEALEKNPNPNLRELSISKHVETDNGYIPVYDAVFYLTEYKSLKSLSLNSNWDKASKESIDKFAKFESLEKLDITLNFEVVDHDDAQEQLDYIHSKEEKRCNKIVRFAFSNPTVKELSLTFISTWSLDFEQFIPSAVVQDIKEALESNNSLNAFKLILPKITPLDLELLKKCVESRPNLSHHEIFYSPETDESDTEDQEVAIADEPEEEFEDLDDLDEDLDEDME